LRQRGINRKKETGAACSDRNKMLFIKLVKCVLGSFEERVKLALLGFVIAVNVIFFYYTSYVTELESQKWPCGEILSGLNNGEEFIHTTEQFKEVMTKYNTCTRTYETEKFVITKVVEIKRKKSYPYSPFKPLGIMAVIQKMSLFMDEVTESECVDNIQFSENGPMEPEKTCGFFSPNEGVNSTSGPMSFISYSNKIHVSYALNSKYDIPVGGLGKHVNIKLTSFYECPNPENNEKETLMKRCSDSNPSSCIPAEYFCDGIFNCADFGDGYGWDESNCNLAEEEMNVLLSELNNVTDPSSELNIKNYGDLPTERLSSGSMIALMLVFTILPILILSYITVCCCNTEDFKRIQRKEDLNNLRILLQRHGVLANNLRQIRVHREENAAQFPTCANMKDAMMENAQLPTCANIKAAMMENVINIPYQEENTNVHFLHLPKDPPPIYEVVHL